MHITACYITKNEAQFLGRSLASIAGVPDETIVVDTGSTDETVAIARRYGATVLTFPWCDDFAAARNYALDHVPPSGDPDHWILFLDADESFAPPIRRAQLEELLTGSAAEGYFVRMLHDERDGQQSESWSTLRMFRFSPHLRYAGRIHEQVVHIDDRARPLTVAHAPRELVLHHLGYRAEVSEAKARRNLALLERDMREHGLQPGVEGYFAETKYALGDYEDAIRWAKAAIASPVIQVGAEAEPYHILLESLRHLGGREQEMARWAGRAIARFPEMPEFYGERGMTYSAMGRWSEARRDLIEALIRYEERVRGLRAPSRQGGYFTRRIAGQLAARLGEMLALAGDRAEAATWFRLAQRYAPDEPRVAAKVEQFRQTGEGE